MTSSEIFNEVREATRWLTFKRDNVVLSGEKGPIVGIRGLGGGWPKDIVKYFSESSYAGVFMNLGLQTGSIDSYIEAVKKEVETYHNPVIVGFSMGGIVALRYAQLYGWGDIRKVITVGMPFNGVKMFSKIKKLGGVYKDLSPQSSLLKELRNDKVPPHKLLNIFAKFDQFVGDHNSFDVPSEKIEVNIVGHNSLMNGTSWISSLDL